MKQTNQPVFSKVEYIPLGEAAILIEFGKSIDLEIHRKVKALADYLDNNSFCGMIEYVAAFSSVTVFYDPLMVKVASSGLKQGAGQTAFEVVVAILKSLVAQLDCSTPNNPKIVEIPVCYGGEFGPDLKVVASHNQLDIDEVIHIHSSGEYLVYMIGFAPGFPYLGGLDERISTPRRQSPRTTIPARTVGIAGMQTGVYPIATPGGWQLIGRTPIELFRPKQHPPSLLQAGDLVKFKPISLKEYQEYEGESQCVSRFFTQAY